MNQIIKSIQFNNGYSLELQQDSIVVFVGANNVGKTQALKDIHQLLCKQTLAPVIVPSIEINKPPVEEMRQLAESISDVQLEGGRRAYYGYGFQINERLFEQYDREEDFPNGLGGLITVFIDTQRRLNTINSSGPLGPGTKKQNLMYSAVYDSAFRKQLDDSFYSAFGTHIVPDRISGGGGGIGAFLRTGEPVRLKEQEVTEESLDEFIRELEIRPEAQNQGDGIRGYLGIMLEFVAGYRKVVFIDEPESFLHPPQSRAIGRSIGEMLGADQQAFIATHSKDVVLGLLESSEKRVILVRIERKGKENSYFKLDGDGLKSIYDDSLLRYSNILDGIFRSHVVLCESDSDCKMYSIVLDVLSTSSGSHPDVLFVHSGGKHRMPIVLDALIKLGIPVDVVADMDILDAPAVLEKMLTVCGQSWDEIKDIYSSFVKSLDVPNSVITRTGLRDSIGNILDESADSAVSDDELKRIEATLKKPSKWVSIKRFGEQSISRGQQWARYTQIKDALSKAHIHLVPCGEIENFVKDATGHGPHWVNNVLEMYPDLDDEVYDEIKGFVANWRLWETD